MERTIGGTPVSQVFKKLKGEIPGCVKYTDDKNQPYLDAVILRAHFDAVMPAQNYDFTCTEPQLVQVGSRACFVCTGTITVYDDEGRKICAKSYVGANNVILLRDGGEPKDLSMDYKNAVVAARKECIRLFGCGEGQLEDAKARAKGKKVDRPVQKHAQPQPPTPQQPQQQVSAPPVGKGKFKLILSQGEKVLDKPSYVLVPVLCLDYGRHKTNLLLWKNSANRLPEILDRIMSGEAIVVSGRFEEYSGKYRIVFERLEG